MVSGMIDSINNAYLAAAHAKELRCDRCHRIGYDAVQGDNCYMEQPHGGQCGGIFGPEKKSTAPPFQLLGIHCGCGANTGATEMDKGEGEITCHDCGRKYKVINTGGPTPEDRYKAALDELDKWIRMLHTAPRSGNDKDKPEGARTVTISDTLAQNMADCLRELRDTAVKGL